MAIPSLLLLSIGMSLILLRFRSGSRHVVIAGFLTASFLLLFPLISSRRAVAMQKILPPALTKTHVEFDRDIRPILAENCYACHGPVLQMSSFRLDQKESALAGGNSG